MAKANLVTVLSLDSTKFRKGFKTAGRTVEAFQNRLGGLGRGLDMMRRSFTALSKVGVAVTATMTLGLQRALSLGGRLSDVADQTGLTVKTIITWEEAMRQGGVQGELFGSILNKAQKSIHDLGRGLSTQKDAFRRLNLEFAELAAMSPEEQLQKIISGLEDMGDITSKIGVARDIFGRQGSRLFSTIFDKSAFDKAEQVLGDQIGLLNKNASAFDRIADVIASMGVKLQGFFVGMADTLLPKLQAAAEAWADLDFAQAGRAFGTFISNGIDNLKEVPKVLWAGLKLVLAKFAKFISDKFSDIGKSVGPKLIMIGKKIFQFLIDGLQKMLRSTLSGGLLKKEGGIMEKLGKGKDKVTGGIGMFLAGAGDKLGFGKSVDELEEDFNEMFTRVFGSAGPMPRAFKYTAVQIMDILEREFGSEGMLRIVRNMNNKQIQAAFGNNLSQSIREIKGRGPRKGRVGTSALDELIGRRQESIRRDAGYGSSGYNPTTDRVNAQGFFGGKNFSFDTSGQLGNLGKKLDIFGTAPSQAQRNENAQRLKKSESAKQTAELRKMGDVFRDNTEEVKKIILKLEDMNMLLGDATGSLA